MEYELFRERFSNSLTSVFSIKMGENHIYNSERVGSLFRVFDKAGETIVNVKRTTGSKDTYLIIDSDGNYIELFTKFNIKEFSTKIAIDSNCIEIDKSKFNYGDSLHFRVRDEEGKYIGNTHDNSASSYSSYCAVLELDDYKNLIIGLLIALEQLSYG